MGILHFFRTKAQKEPGFELTKPSTGQDYNSGLQPHPQLKGRKANGKDTRAPRSSSQRAYNKLSRRWTTEHIATDARNP